MIFAPELEFVGQLNSVSRNRQPLFFWTMKSQLTDNQLFSWIFLIGLMTVVGCYSFKGATISPDVNTFYVKNFESRAANAPANLPIQFTEALKDKIRSESRLRPNEDNPDVEFSGYISGFQVRAVAPKQDETVSQNQLVITVHVDFTNSKDETKNFNQDKSFFLEFPTTSDLLSVQDDLILQINKQLVEDIFNAAFNNW